MAEWSHFGVTLLPTSNGSDGENGHYDVHSGREDSRSAEPGKKRLLVLMLFLDLPESHSTSSKLCELDVTYVVHWKWPVHVCSHALSYRCKFMHVRVHTHTNILLYYILLCEIWL